MQPTHFSLFGLPASFDVDVAALDRKYLALQVEHHPDRLVGESPEEKAQAMQATVRINDAWHILKSPLRRAIYLLSLHGMTPAKAEEALLMEAMEHRETLEEADSADAIDALQVQARKAMESCIDALAKAFQTEDVALAARQTTRLQYLEKFVGEIRLKKLKGITT